MRHNYFEEFIHSSEGACLAIALIAIFVILPACIACMEWKFQRDTQRQFYEYRRWLRQWTLAQKKKKSGL